MAKKKISELSPGSFVRGDDVIPYSTGLRDSETPTTKKITKAQLLMSEGAAHAYEMIIKSNPLHYFTVNPFGDASYDEITQAGANATASYYASVPHIGGRPLHLAAGNTNPIFTQPVLTIGSQISVVVSFRANSTAIMAACGNGNWVASPNLSGFGIGVNAPSGGRNYVRYYNEAQTFVTLSVAGHTANANHVFVWTFDATDGHKFYRNGALVGQDERTEAIKESSAGFTIGHERREVTGSTGWTGPIWDTAIYNRVLTPTEIQDISDAILGV
jgi:hypothetical protein